MASSSPAAASCSAAYWRIVSSNWYPPPSPCFRRSDFSTSRAVRSATLRRGLAVARADLLDRRRGRTHRRTRAIRRSRRRSSSVSRASLHSTVARSDRCAPSARRAACGSRVEQIVEVQRRCPPDRARPPAPPQARWRAGGHRRGGRSLRGDGRRDRCRATPASWRLLAPGTGAPPGSRRSPHGSRPGPTTDSGASR